MEETRLALLAIMLSDPESVEPMNALLHQYARYIIGRMGIPYRAKNVNMISVALDAPQPVVSALSGKLGMLPGVTIKAVYSKN